MNLSTKASLFIAPLFFASLVSVEIISCKSSPKNNPLNNLKISKLAERQSKYVAVYKKPDGTNDVAIMLAVIDSISVQDTITKERKVFADTLWGKPTLVPLFDSLGHKKKDTSGREIITTRYLSIPKDSVNYHIEGKDIDSLIKHFNY